MTSFDWSKSTSAADMLQHGPLQHGPLRAVTARKHRLFLCACCRSVAHLLKYPGSRRAVEVAERFADGLAGEEELLSANDEAECDNDALGEDADAVHGAHLLAAWVADPDVIKAVRTAAGLNAIETYLATALSQAERADLLREVFGASDPEASLPTAPVCRPCGGEGGRKTYLWHGHYKEEVCAACAGSGHAGGLARPYLTDRVRSLVEAAYAVRGPRGELEPDRLAVLSDALEEDGFPTHAPCLACGGVGQMTYHSAEASWLASFEYGLECEQCRGRGKLPHPLLAHLRSPGPHWPGCYALDLFAGRR